MDPTSRAARLRTMRSSFFLAASLIVALPSTVARAAPPSSSSSASSSSAPTTLVIIADAPASKQAVAGLGGKLPERWRVGDEDAFRKALASAGQRTPAGVALGNAAARASLATKARAAASASGTGAVLFVRVTPKQRNTRVVTLFMIAPGEADAIVDTTIEAPTSDDGAALVSAIAPALTKLAPAAQTPSAPAADPSGTPDKPASPGASSDAPADGKPSAPLGGHETSILVFSAGGGNGARVVRYYDNLTPLLRTYDLPASPNLVIAAEVYPFARLKVPFLRNVGFAGGFQRAVGVSSETSKGTSVSTSFWRVEGGLRLRFGFGLDDQEDPRFVLGVQGGVVKERFGFEGDKTLVPWLPDVDYLFGKVGVDGRLRAGPIGLLAGFSYLPALSGGTFADRFRDTSVGAIDLSFGLAVPIVRVFEMRATALYTRAFYSFHPEPGDTYVAGGALDHIIRAQILATLLL